MEVSAIRHMGAAGAHGRSPLLRLQSDERLVTLIRRGNHHAFEALVSRYESRLLAFCRHMVRSREDAEDVLQEVFAAAFNAMLADDRPINVRPWLYRIARNRSLNHLRRTQAVGVDSMDVHFADHGLTTAEKAHRREDFRLLIADVQELPEAQRTALLLREIDALSYEQIAEAMENTVPSVKSLLVRARVGLAEAAEARLLDCEVVRFELGEVAEGLKRISPPVRRHVRTCEQCTMFRRQLADTNRQLAALLPVGPLLILKKTLLAQLGTAAAASSGPVAAGSAAGGALQLTLSGAAGKAAAGLAAAAIVTAGAVEAKHVAIDRDRAAVVVTASSPSPVPPPAPVIAAPAPSASGELTPVVPGLEPFAPAGAPVPASDDKPQGLVETADETGETTPSEVDAAGSPGTPGGSEAEAETPVAAPLNTDTPLLAGVPAASVAEPLGTPIGSQPIAAPVLIEGVVRPADAALGTPVTGVVSPDSVDQPPQPIVEPLTPIAVSLPEGDAGAPVSGAGDPAAGIVASPEPPVTDPLATDPVATEPVATEPSAPEPTTTEPEAPEPADVVPAPSMPLEPAPAPAPADIPETVEPAEAAPMPEPTPEPLAPAPEPVATAPEPTVVDGPTPAPAA